MATTEAATASAGPRYAPDDPTLPQPWKGLIDGATGVLYYWNPETSVTQYERPFAPPPALPAGAPPFSEAPKLAQIPVPSAGQGHLAQHEQTKPGGHVPQQHGLQQQQQFPSQSVRPQMLQQHPGQQMPQQSVQQFPNQQSQPMVSQPHGHPSLQTYQVTPQHQVMQNQHLQMPQQLGPQYAHTQQQYMGYQFYMTPQGLQNSHQTPQASAQGQQFASQKEYNSVMLKREGEEFHGGKKSGFSQPSHLQHVEDSPSQNIHFEANPAPQRTNANLAHAQQYNGPQANMQRPAAVTQFQPPGANLVHQQLGPRPLNHMDPTVLHQKPHASPFQPNNTFENNLQPRPGNDSYVRGAQPLHPAVMPKDIRTSGGPPMNADPTMGQTGHGGYVHSGPAFPNQSLLRPPFVTPLDVHHLSPVELYRKQHEVTTT